MEENLDEIGGRRTRSGRKTNTSLQSAMPVRGRRTRKAVGKIAEADVSEEELLHVEEEKRDDHSINDFENLTVEQDPIIEVIYNSDEVITIEENNVDLNVETQVIQIDDENSFKDEDEQQTIIETVILENSEYVQDMENTENDEYEEQIEKIEIECEIKQDEPVQENDVEINEINQIELIQEQEPLCDQIKDQQEPVEIVTQDMEMREIQLSAEKLAGNVEEENGSSFPFGIGCIQQSDNSDNKVEEVADSGTVEVVDSSLLASLAGDNANSLPSVGEESLSKDNFEKTDPVVIEEETSQSENAIAEDLPNGNDTDKTINTVDAEMISEDELQNTPPQKPKIKDAEEVSDEEFQTSKIKVKDAEEVSDEELPAPKRAELPPDAEIISDEELPNNGNSKKETSKRKADALKEKAEEYNPGSPTGEESVEAVPEKKIKVEVKEELKEKKKEKKKLPELDKYWKAVKHDPSDFAGWTYLLQYVDQETDVEAAREAYDAFLANYPYCYGYWRKYADYEKRKGDKEKCYEVFERGLKAIPLSVDLWMHYLNHVKTNHPENEEFIRSQFNRAVDACGLEFRSDKLWELYIRWESEAKRYNFVVKIYDRLLTIPTQGYNSHFESFQDLITNHSAALTVSVDEFKKHRHDVREAMRKAKEKKCKDSDSPPGDEQPVDDPDEADDHVRNEEEMSAIKDKIISNRRKVHKLTVSAVASRWTYEEGIKRPYFHVKPLERSQLKNWKEYLDFEIEKGDRKRILILFERCLIACALYDDFWLKLIRYLETALSSSPNDATIIDLTRDAFARACTIHHRDKPSLHLMWSAFEEVHLNYDKAAEILTNIDERCPNLLQIAYRRINLERRRGNLDKCGELYEYYIQNAKNKNIAGSLCIKYARFCHKILKNIDKGIQILRDTLANDSSNTRIALQMIDIALQRETVDEKEIVEIMDKFTSRDNIDPDQKVLFAQRKVEFLEDFGSTAKGLQEAQRALQIALQKANESKKKTESSSPNSKTSSKENKSTTATVSAPTYNNANNYYNTGATPNYYNSGQQQQQYQQSYDSYGYNHWQYGSGYSGYGQWSGYGSYY
ncbi:pre-mRNA-processing factor 39 [Condylostylus longicornis]|uniref:pre-mRNA-processing factor 39 n=1 Tax=Condylostylus longicornis TaxID=2530218 RepID=UPI00244E073E|nr:pre-mRNA-processing factor 39 [Condylostylus longicornis]